MTDRDWLTAAQRTRAAHRKTHQLEAEKPAVELTEEQLWWTPAKEAYYQHHITGNLDTVIAGKPEVAGAHRNTLRDWRKNAFFRARVAENDREELSGATRRRFNQVTALTGSLAADAANAQKEYKLDPTNELKFKRYLTLAEAFARFRGHERIEHGLPVGSQVVKHQHSGGIGVDVDVVVRPGEEDARTFLSRLRLGASARAETNPERMLGAALAQAAAETNIIDVIDAEETSES